MTLNDYVNKEQQKFDDFKAWYKELRYEIGETEFPINRSDWEWEELYNRFRDLCLGL